MLLSRLYVLTSPAVLPGVRRPREVVVVVVRERVRQADRHVGALAAAGARAEDERRPVVVAAVADGRGMELIRTCETCTTTVQLTFDFWHIRFTGRQFTTFWVVRSSVGVVMFYL